MADSTVGGLPAAAQLDDTSLLVVEQQGVAKRFTGAQFKEFGKNAAKAYVDTAKKYADDAEKSAQKAAQTVDSIDAEIDKAKAEVENAKAEVDNAKAEVENAKKEVENAKAEVENAKAEVQNAKDEVQRAADEADRAESEADKAKEYSGKPAIPKDKTWWVWNADKKEYEDTEQPSYGNILYATFDIDPETGILWMQKDTPEYTGPNFVVNDNGFLEVEVKANG